jgi:hypothetical protein
MKTHVHELRIRDGHVDTILWFGESFDTLSKRLYPNVKFIPYATSSACKVIGAHAHYCRSWRNERDAGGAPFAFIALTEMPATP